MTSNDSPSSPHEPNETSTDQNDDRIGEVYFGKVGGQEQQRRARDRIDWMVAQRRGETALDIGCSQGVISLLLARAGIKTIGVDVNPNAIEAAERLIESEPADIRKSVTFRIANATDPEFIDGTFDTISIGEVIEHLPNPEALVHSAAAKLADGGAFILTTPHGFLPHDDHYQAFGLHEIINLLPPYLSVVSIETADGYVRLLAEKDGGKANRPSPEELLVETTRSMIGQQKFLYETIASRRTYIEKLSSDHKAADQEVQEQLASVKRIALRRKKEAETNKTKLTQANKVAAEKRRQLEMQTQETETVKALIEEKSEQLASIAKGATVLGEQLHNSREIIDSLITEIGRAENKEDVLRERVHLRQEQISWLQKSRPNQAGLAFRQAIRRPFPDLFRLPMRLWKLQRGKLVLSDKVRENAFEKLTEKSKRRRKKSKTKTRLVSGDLRLVGGKPREGDLRKIYWAAMRAGDLRSAYDSILQLQALFGPNPTPAQTERMERLVQGPAMNLAALDDIPDQPEKAIKSVPNRVVYVLHNSLPYSSGGYATRAQGFATGVANTGREVICITRPGYPLDIVADLDPKTLSKTEVIDGITYIRTLGLEYTGGGSGIRYIRPASKILMEAFEEHKPACVVAASSHMTALPALIAARSLGIPFIYEVRGFWEITRLSREPEFEHKVAYKSARILEAEVARRADHVLTLTKPMKEELISRGVPAKQITLAPNSCDIDQFEPRNRDLNLASELGIPADVPVIGYIGTFVQYEGLENLTDACVKMKECGVEFRLLLVGNENASGLDRGPITEKIMQIAETGGINDWLIMPGRIPHEEVASYYSLIDIAPFPRKPQPVTEMVSPMKPLEAMAMEKAVVVSSVKALAEMVEDGKTGLIFEKGNVDALADTLMSLIKKPKLRAELGSAGRKWVAQERTWTKTAGIVQDVVSSLTGTKPDGRAKRQLKSPGPANPKVLLGAQDLQVYSGVQQRYAERDAKLGKKLFSPDDWKRVEIALAATQGARHYGDIGIGQGQLVNCLSEREGAEAVFGYDFRRHSKLIEPSQKGIFQFVEWDIVKEPTFEIPPLDIVIAMEVFEHITPDQLPTAIDHTRSLAQDKALFFSVPYNEQEPLYHHDKPGGHQQSFDDTKIEAIFGPNAVWTNYLDKWYLGFSCDTLTDFGPKPLEELLEIIQSSLRKNLAIDVKAV